VGKGDVRAATLLLLAEQPLHGYQIIHLIEEQSNGLWRPSAGSVYPALQLLEDEGLVQAESVEGRRVYHLTEAGRAHVEERRDELTAARDAVTATVAEGWVELHDLLRQVDTALTQVAQVGTPAQRGAAAALLVRTRRQLYRILAEDADDATPPDTGHHVSDEPHDDDRR
jgi:DNA-binding PadR family transcriptional regulator